ncbi:MAG: hypothetical protein PHV06_04310 [bacterium]|nr:hypothetical protein [bacterium]
MGNTQRNKAGFMLTSFFIPSGVEGSNPLLQKGERIQWSSIPFQGYDGK